MFSNHPRDNYERRKKKNRNGHSYRDILQNNFRVTEIPRYIRESRYVIFDIDVMDLLDLIFFALFFLWFYDRF